MKKRKIQRWIKRVSCRVGALLSIFLILSTMVVPAFASNNASTQKWYVADEAQLVAESGQTVRYLKLTPYVNGAEFTYTSMCRHFSTSWRVASTASPQSEYVDFLVPWNYPDWFRSNLPLGAFTYVDFTLVSASSYAGGSPSSSFTPLSSAYFYIFDSSFALTSSVDYSMPGSSSLSSNSNISSPSGTIYGTSPFYCIYGPSGQGPLSATGYNCNVGTTYRFNISNTINLTTGPFQFVTRDNQSSIYFTEAYISNLTSNRLCVLVGLAPASSSARTYVKAQFKLSFWVDANKLPAGLQVGDEFPANNDAFDDLRDELLKQFPEASENIENGKDTINGWNDTETVGEDVASSSLSVINGLFQNLGQFLAVVSLMIFGAVVLRMLIRKAVDG